MTLRSTIARIPLEALIWAAALVGLALLGPTLDGQVSFCIPSALGLDFCWGCGLGSSVSHALRGQVAASWQAHPLGLLTVAVLIGRILSLVNHSRSNP
jgi:hypothetical protein